jgi:hypothetical protein
MGIIRLVLILLLLVWHVTQHVLLVWDLLLSVQHVILRIIDHTIATIVDVNAYLAIIRLL